MALFQAQSVRVYHHHAGRLQQPGDFDLTSPSEYRGREREGASAEPLGHGRHSPIKKESFSHVCAKQALRTASLGCCTTDEIGPSPQERTGMLR